MLYSTETGISKYLDTGKNSGDSFTWRISADKDYAITRFIDRRTVGTFPKVDINEAGIVNLSDIAYIKKNFGKKS